MGKNKRIRAKKVRSRKIREAQVTSFKNAVIVITGKGKAILKPKSGFKAEKQPKIYKDGGGELQGKKYEPYVELKTARKEYLSKHFSCNKRPWYFLTKGHVRNYEERKFDWGTKTDSFTVESEMSKINNHKSNNLTRDELLNGYIAHKVAKWEAKNPKPCKDDDIFKEEFIPEWEDKKKDAIEKITKSVVEHYSKLKVIERYRTKDPDKFVMKPFEVMRKNKCLIVPSKDGELNLSNVLQNHANSCKKNDKNFVCLHLLDESDQLVKVGMAA